MLQLGYVYNDLYDMTLFELVDTLECRRKGLAYEMWKLGSLSQLVKEYPETPEKACPELYPKKKGIDMPDFLKEKYYKREGFKINE